MQKKKNKINKIIISQVVITITGFLILSVMIVSLMDRVVSRENEINKEIKEFQEENRRLEGQRNELKNTIEYLDSEQFTLEHARKNLNLKKINEEVIIIKGGKSYNDGVGKTANNRYEANKEIEVEVINKNLQNWWNFFFNRRSL